MNRQFVHRFLPLALSLCASAPCYAFAQAASSAPVASPPVTAQAVAPVDAAAPTPASAPIAGAAAAPASEPAAAPAQQMMLPADPLMRVKLKAAEAKADEQANAEPVEPADEPSNIVWHPEARVMTGFELERERPSADQGGTESTEYGFFLDQARVGLEAEVDLLSIDVSADLADAVRPKTTAADFKQPPYLRNAYLNVRLHKAFRVRAGRFKRPFSRLELTSSGALPMRGRGLTNGLIIEDAQWGGRALGLMLWGRLPGKLSWHAAISNPTWATDRSLEANGLEALARATWEPIDALELGLSGGHKLEVRADGERSGNAISFDARVKLGELDFVLDAMAAELVSLSPTAAAQAPLALGLAAYLTYRVDLAKGLELEPVLFGEFSDSDSEFARTEAARMIIGCNLLVGDHLRVMPQVELVRPIGTASTLSEWSAGETYYLMLAAQL